MALAGSFEVKFSSASSFHGPHLIELHLITTFDRLLGVLGPHRITAFDGLLGPHLITALADPLDIISILL